MADVNEGEAGEERSEETSRTATAGSGRSRLALTSELPLRPHSPTGDAIVSWLV